LNEKSFFVGLKFLRIPVNDCISEKEFIMALPFEM
jgi:hypothetical protein